MERVKYHEGFYTVENDGQRDFRWMRREAGITLSAVDGRNWVRFTCGNPHGTPVTLSISGTKPGLYVLAPGWTTFCVCLEDTRPGADNELRLFCGETLSVPDESRELSLMMGEIKEETPENGIVPIEGFYTEERDNLRTFVWMRDKASLCITDARPGEWLLFYIKSPSAWAEPLTIRNAGKSSTVHVLPGEWKVVGWPVEELGGTGVFELETTYTLENQNDNDPRRLSFMISGMHVGVPTEYEKNSALMHKEVFKESLVKSVGTLIACDTSSECNLRCIMCVIEKEFRDKSKEKGCAKIINYIDKLIKIASKVQPYLTGEPFYNDDIWHIIDMAGAVNKERTLEFEISTNALLLNKKKIEKLLDSCVTSLQISVNASTKKTYKNLCGGNFDRLIRNISLLCNSELKSNKVCISLSYVLMRENMEELPDFIILANKLNADSIQIWPLNHIVSGTNSKTMEDGREFIYEQQEPKYYPILTKKTMDKTSEMGKALNVRMGETPSYRIDCCLENDFPYPLDKESFLNLVSNVRYKIPVSSIYRCYFPWYGFFFTTDGCFAPCVHLIYNGGIDNIIGKSINDVWNSKIMMGLRNMIVSGEVPEICKNAQCPFV